MPEQRNNFTVHGLLQQSSLKYNIARPYRTTILNNSIIRNKQLFAICDGTLLEQSSTESSIINRSQFEIES